MDGQSYTLLKDSYYGTGGYQSGDYLLKHKRETDADYQDRKRSAYYLNYFAPIVNALVDPIFKRKPLRDGNVAALGKQFLTDVDGHGTDIHCFMKQAGLVSKMYGVAFIVLDNYRVATGRAKNLSDMLQQRIFPYAYIVAPENVLRYETNTKGELQSITFREVENIQDGRIEYKEVTFTMQGWKIEGDTHRAEGTYQLGRLPVVPLYSRLLDAQTVLPIPELLAVAKTGAAIYNHCSWLSEILRKQTFPLLTVPTLDATDMVVGNNNALGYAPESGHAPAFIAPPSDPATILQGQITGLIQEMYRMAGLTFMTPQGNQISGISRQWEFERTNQQLANFALQCARAEEQVMTVFGRWINQEIRYTVSYPADFGIVDVAGELAEAQAVLDLGLGNGLKEEVLKRVLSVYCPEMEAGRAEELVNELATEEETEKEDHKHSTAEDEEQDEDE